MACMRNWFEYVSLILSSESSAFQHGFTEKSGICTIHSVSHMRFSRLSFANGFARGSGCNRVPEHVPDQWQVRGPWRRLASTQQAPSRQAVRKVFDPLGHLPGSLALGD